MAYDLFLIDPVQVPSDLDAWLDDALRRDSGSRPVPEKLRRAHEDLRGRLHAAWHLDHDHLGITLAWADLHDSLETIRGVAAELGLGVYDYSGGGTVSFPTNSVLQRAFTDGASGRECRTRGFVATGLVQGAWPMPDYAGIGQALWGRGLSGRGN